MRSTTGVVTTGNAYGAIRIPGIRRMPSSHQNDKYHFNIYNLLRKVIYMKRILPILLSLLLLCGCGAPAAQPEATEPAPTQAVDPVPPAVQETAEIPYESRFDGETVIRLTDTGMDVSGPNSLTVFGSHDIIYYEDRDTYESGNPYGEGSDADKHTAAEAEGHYVVNITAPGTYRVTGKLTAGQIRVDLGDDAYDDPNAVVELILDNADITCTVAPAILFMNVYECDGNWSEDTAKPDVDTSAAGANLILEGENTVNGSYVARIYKDKAGEKKLWKQDGAIYSYMSLNVFGPGSLVLNAANEGLDTELHLTVNGGNITILSDNDGINTNEDNVSVTTINAGTVHIVAGLGAEGDGIDSNGYLVINGGTVISAAKPIADSGLDSDKGSFIHGGTVVALGAAMDWAESDSDQVTVNLQFSKSQSGPVSIQTEAGAGVFTFDPAADPVLKEYTRSYQGLILSSPNFRVGDSYTVTVDGVPMAYTSTDVMRGPGGFGGGQFSGFPEGGFDGKEPPQGFEGGMPEGFGGQMPDFSEGEMPSMPEGFEGQMPGGFSGEVPEGFDGNFSSQAPGGFGGGMPEGFDGEIPEGFDGEMPSRPEGEMPEGFGDFGGRGDRDPSGVGTAEGSTVFYMMDKVNFFSGIYAAQ